MADKTGIETGKENIEENRQRVPSTASNRLMLGRENSFIFFQVDVIPLHPLVRQKFREEDCLDYSLINESVDEALRWFYLDAISHREIGDLIRYGSPPFLQDRQGEDTKDIEVINTWLNKSHDYLGSFQDPSNFPINLGLSISPKGDGIFLGTYPAIIGLESRVIRKDRLKELGMDKPAEEEVMKDYGIVENDWGFVIPGFWYTKDGSSLVKLFGKNFAINYTNRLLQRYQND